MNPWIVVPALLLIAAVFVLIPVAAAAFSRFRRPLRVPCPAAHTEAQIEVDAAGAVRAELLGRAPAVAGCSLWPARRGCTQGCLDQSMTQWRDAPAKEERLTPA